MKRFMFDFGLYRAIICGGLVWGEGISGINIKTAMAIIVFAAFVATLQSIRYKAGEKRGAKRQRLQRDKRLNP